MFPNSKNKCEVCKIIYDVSNHQIHSRTAKFEIDETAFAVDPMSLAMTRLYEVVVTEEPEEDEPEHQWYVILAVVLAVFLSLVAVVIAVVS